MREWASRYLKTVGDFQIIKRPWEKSYALFHNGTCIETFRHKEMALSRARRKTAPPAQYSRKEHMMKALYTDSRGYELLRDHLGHYHAGCRHFSLDEAIAHWGGSSYPDYDRGQAFLRAVIEAEGRAQGGKTLAELNPSEGDILEIVTCGRNCPTLVKEKALFKITETGLAQPEDDFSPHGPFTSSYDALFRPVYKTWGQLSDAEKGALLLAHQQGKTIERGPDWETVPFPGWINNHPYRVKPEPVVTQTTLVGGVYSGQHFCFESPCNSKSWHTYSLSFPTLNQEPVLGTYTDDKGNQIVISERNT